MGTGEPHITVGDFTLGAGLYRQLCEYGAKRGVTPLIETNGDLSSSKAMLAFLDRAGSDNCGVLWDVHHTVRFGSESPVETFAALGTYVKHVHLKDSVMRGSRVEYRMSRLRRLLLPRVGQALEPRPSGARHRLRPLQELHGLASGINLTGLRIAGVHKTVKPTYEIWVGFYYVVHPKVCRSTAYQFDKLGFVAESITILLIRLL